jgi:hypothetical protein
MGRTRWAFSKNAGTLSGKPVTQHGLFQHDSDRPHTTKERREPGSLGILSAGIVLEASHVPSQLLAALEFNNSNYLLYGDSIDLPFPPPSPPPKKKMSAKGS